MNIDVLDELLANVACPARYIGGEINMVKKNAADIRYLLFFPDLYELGMSNLGFQILYFLLNERADTYCERAFSLWGDMAAQLREKSVPLYSLETFTPLSEFDIIGVSLQYELCYTNVLDMLSLSGIPVFSKDRDEECPLIMAGGLCAYNPEPLADIIDCFYIGEGEASLGAFMDLYSEHKASGRSKREFLQNAAKLEAIYVPSLYDVSYNEDGTIKEFSPNHENAPVKVMKALVKEPDNAFFPDKLLVPLIEITQGRVVAEIFRGCIRGCRFCQAGFVNRPQREKSVGCIVDTFKRLADSSGYEELSLMSLSTSDYSRIRELIPEITKAFEGERVTLSLPSLRVDSFTIELFETLYGMKRTSLTIAPEAGTQRLRDVINKNLTEEEILGGVSLAFNAGWDKIKLYFMSGLPTETQDDLNGIAELCERIYQEYYKLPKEKRGRPVSVSASSSCFVPKPHTPFQWDSQLTAEEFIESHIAVKKNMRKQIRYTYHEARMAVIEGALARGDRRVGAAVYNAYMSGCRFDGWSEHFDSAKWLAAFEEAGLSLSFYNGRTREYAEILPWEHISCGVTKEFLISERENALKGAATPNCREACGGCGAPDCGGICVEN